MESRFWYASGSRALEAASATLQWHCVGRQVARHNFHVHRGWMRHVCGKPISASGISGYSSNRANNRSFQRDVVLTLPIPIPLLKVLHKIIKVTACLVYLSERIQIAAQTVIVDCFQPENQIVSSATNPRFKSKSA